MRKNIFVYPCDSFIGRSVSKAFSAAGHVVSGIALTGANVPPSVTTVIRADDSDVTAAHRQLLLTADVVVYDLLGNERATRDAVVQLAQQPYGGREVAFVAVSSPLVWAATRPSPEAVFTSAVSIGAAAAISGEWGAVAAGGEGVGGDDGGAVAAAAAGGEGTGEAPWAGAGGRTGTGSGSGAGTGSGDGEEAAAAEAVPFADAVAIAALFGAPVENVLARSANTPRIAPTFRAPEDVARRIPAASARAALAVEHLVLRAGRRGRLRTAVVCPGLLYGEGEDDVTFCNAFKAAWTWQCLPTRPAAGAPRPRLLVYGRGTNILPTLHVADLASYIMALTGSQQQQQQQQPVAVSPPPPPPPPPGTTAVSSAPAPSTAAAAAAGTSALAPAPPSAQTVGSSVGLGLASGSVGSSLVLANTSSGAPPVGGSFLSSGAPHLSNYYLVSDGSRCSQSELMAAIAAALGVGGEEGAIEAVPESELHRHPPDLRSRMLLDLSFATTPLPAAPSPSGSSAQPWAPSRPGGLPAQLAGVVEEFRTVRSLTPLRVLVTGPPLAGKTHLARRLAARYGLAYISVPLLLAAAADPAVATAAGLNPAMDPALLRAAQLEVAAGPSGAVNTKQEKERDKDKEAPNPGWMQTGGRVSAKTLGALLASALADPRVAARCRGFVLDGFPRSAAQARAAFYSLQVDEAAMAALEAEQSRATLKGHKSHKGLSANPSTPKLGGGDRGGPDSAAVSGGHAGGGAYADVFEVPPAHRLAANPLTAPTHVIELDVGEEELRGRLAALAAAADEAVTRLTGEASQAADADKKGPGTPSKKPPGGGGGPGGKGAASGVIAREVLLAAALGHNVEAGFARRLTAYGNWRAEDAADLRSRVAAAQAAWEAERARQEAEAARLAAEASTLKAKRRRARAAAAAAAAAAASGGPTVTISGEDDGDDVAAANGPDAAAGAVPPPAPPELPQHGGLMALSLGAGGATYARLPNATMPEGPLLTIPVQPPPAAALVASGSATAMSGAAGPTSIANTVVAAAQAAVGAAPPPPPPPLPALERSVEALLGPPHNLDGFPEPGATPPLVAAPPPTPPTAAAAEPPAAKVGSLAVEAATAASAAGAAGSGGTVAAPATAADVATTGGPAAAAVEAGADASYAYRWRGSRGAAVRRYMLRHVMPVVTAALAEVALARTGGPVPAAAAAAAAVAAVSGGGGGAESGSHPTTPPTPAQSVPGTPGSAAGGAGGPGSSGKEALLHVARALAAAAEAAEAAFVDPYSDPSYAIQLAKIDAKAAREAARAAVAAAKAEREAAARQQQQQQKQLAAKEEEQQQQQ